MHFPFYLLSRLNRFNFFQYLLFLFCPTLLWASLPLLSSLSPPFIFQRISLLSFFIISIGFMQFLLADRLNVINSSVIGTVSGVLSYTLKAYFTVINPFNVRLVIELVTTVDIINLIVAIWKCNDERIFNF